MGSGGVLLCDVTGDTPHLAIEGGKNGLIYVVNRDNMGHFDEKTDHSVQILESQGNWVMSAPVFFKNCLFYNRSGEDIKCRPFADGKFGDVMGTAQGTGGRGGGPVISANGTDSGIVWIIDNGGPGPLAHRLQGGRPDQRPRESGRALQGPHAGRRDQVFAPDRGERQGLRLLRHGAAGPHQRASLHLRSAIGRENRGGWAGGTKRHPPCTLLLHASR